MQLKEIINSISSPKSLNVNYNLCYYYMEEGKIYKKYNCHIIVYKDILNQEKQRQRDIWAYNNRNRDLATKEYQRERQLQEQERLKELINSPNITMIQGIYATSPNYFS
jgi:hypothetical protein